MFNEGVSARRNRYGSIVASLAIAASISSCGGGGSSSSGNIASPAPTPTPTPTPPPCSYTSTSDGTLANNPSELQTALTNLSGNSGVAKIYLSAGTFNISRTLMYDARGSTGTIELIGCGSGQTVLDGQQSVRVFHFMKNGVIENWQTSIIHLPPYPNLIVRGLTVRNGQDASDFNRFGKSGAGMLIERFNTEIYDSIFTNNRGSFIGGALSGPANLKLQNVTFDGNFANNGGSSVAACGSLDITNSDFLRGGSSSSFSGAAVYREICLEQDYSSLPVVVRDSDFSQNRTGLSIIGGYGARADALGSVLIENTRFENNDLRAIDLAGAGNLTIERSTFSDNGPWGRVNDPSKCIDHDLDCENGGAILDRTGSGRFTISNSSFVRNFALDYGGAIDRLGSRRCTDGQTECDPTRTPSFPFDLILNSVVFDGNRSHRGAAISLARTDSFPSGFLNGNMQLNDVTLQNNVGFRPILSVGGTPLDESETSIIVAGGNVSNCRGSAAGNTADVVILAKGSLNSSC